MIGGDSTKYSLDDKLNHFSQKTVNQLCVVIELVHITTTYNVSAYPVILCVNLTGEEILPAIVLLPPTIILLAVFLDHIRFIKLNCVFELEETATIIDLCLIISVW